MIQIPASTDEEVAPVSVIVSTSVTQAARAADSAVQRLADASVWVVFRLAGVRT